MTIKPGNHWSQVASKKTDPAKRPMPKMGKLSPATAAKIRAKANAVLGC